MIDSTATDVSGSAASGLPEAAGAPDTGQGAAQGPVALLQTVADPIRWTVLQQLAQGASCVCNLQEHIPIRASLLSYHLKVLRDAGLVTTSRRGRWIDYALAGDALDRLHAALPAGAAGAGGQVQP